MNDKCRCGKLVDTSHRFYDQSDGLTLFSCCSQCLAKVTEASCLLRQVFGDKLDYISMVGIYQLSKVKEQDSD